MANLEVVAVVHWHARLEIPSPQVKSRPLQDSPLWLRPQAALWNRSKNIRSHYHAGMNLLI
jgi:hypothetical protein